MPHRRRGYTLFELVLVLAIVVIAGAISIPVIDAMMGDHRLTAARDMIRARLADIRGQAMKEGRPYKFSFTPNTGQFKIERLDASGRSTIDERSRQLPDKVLFCKSVDALLGEGTPSEGSGYETAVIYLADGTAREDLPNLVLFGLQGMRARGLQVRPLTGAVSSFEPNNGEELP